MVHHTIGAQDLGIDLASKQESALFRWFLACLLFGKPIQQQVARRSYEVLVEAGVDSVDALASRTWDDLVELLDQGHYVRYDYSTATKLLEISRTLKEQYGSVSELVASSPDARELEQRLRAFRGVGPTTAAIFVHEVAPIYFDAPNSHDYDAAVAAAAVLQKHGFEAYIIGGAVRDLRLGKRPKDFDLVTNATPEQIAKMGEFARSLYKDTAQAFGVTRVRYAYRGVESELEIATFRKDIDSHLGRRATKVEYSTLQDDVMRRDFTVNALALNPATGQVIDYVDGVADLEARTIRFIGDPERRIAEDPLRIVRAIRLKNQLGFMYDEQTANAITEAVQHGEVEKIATDRLRDELTKMFVHPTRRRALMDLDTFGILDRVLPEVTDGKQTKQPRHYHAEGSVWKHQLLIFDYLPDHPSRRLVWAALLHDIGKVATAHSPDGTQSGLQFNEHYTVGADMARTILNRLNFSKRDIADITWMVHYHMAIDDLPNMRPGRRRHMLGHPAFEDLLELHRADAAASWRPDHPHGVKPEFKEIERLWHEYQSSPPELRQPSLKRDLGIDGNWLIKQFGGEHKLTGAAIGSVLAELDEYYQDTGESDREVYVERAHKLLDEL